MATPTTPATQALNGPSPSSWANNINDWVSYFNTGLDLEFATDYTPTLSGTGWAVGNGSYTVARYIQIGDLVYFTILLTFGSTSTAGTAAPAFSLPMSRRTGPPHLAQAYYQVSGNVYFLGPVFTSSIVTLYVSGTNGLRSNLTSTSPASFVASSATNLQVTGIYEAA